MSFWGPVLNSTDNAVVGLLQDWLLGLSDSLEGDKIHGGSFIVVVLYWHTNRYANLSSWVLFSLSEGVLCGDERKMKAICLMMGK